MADIHINEQQLKELTSRFTTLATSIGQVANGAYVTDTMFTTTRATSATRAISNVFRELLADGYDYLAEIR